MSATNLLPTALELAAAGLSVVPVAADGAKRPRGAWKQYTTTAATTAEIDAWFTAELEQGVGVITGYGDVEMLEIEGRAMGDMPAVLELLDGTGLRPLYDQLLTAWSEQSPSGGLHLFYRIAGGDVPGNTKIAQAPTDGPTGRDTLAETRGTGGFVVLAPSTGPVHPTGRPWIRLAGGPATLPTIDRETRDALHAIIHAALDTMPAETAAGPVDSKWTISSPRVDGDVTPGDDYEARTDWTDILTGWTLVFTRGHTRYWRRPGKNDGISATTGRADDRDRLYVFSSSTSFEPEIPYTKFGAYALLHHHGDHTAAAKQLAVDNYGHRAERTITPPAPAASSSTPGERTTPLGNVSALPSAFTVTGNEDQLTDDGNARLLVQAYANRLKWVPDMGRWATWDDTRWIFHPDDGPAITAARDVIRALPTDNKQLAQHRIRSMRARAIRDAVGLARADDHMRVAAEKFDRHGWQLNTPAGVVNLRTGDTATPLPTLYHSKQTAVSPDPDHPTPLWNQFLATTFQHDTVMERYVQRLVGLSAIGEVIEHVLPYLHGSGGNGKTVFLETCTTLLGDYATEAPAGFLIAGRDRHPTELANLQGRRVVVDAEVNDDTKFDESKMKSLTGGDKITARFMGKDFFTFVPTHTMWLMGNTLLKVETGGHSFWRRLRLIPFTHEIAEDHKIEDLQARLVEEEGPGILHWIIRGAVEYAARGLDTPDAVIVATDRYRAEEDHLGRFVDDRCRVGGGENVRVEMSELRRAYDQWCREENETEISSTALGRQLKQKFDIGTAKSHGRRFYTNVMLYAPEEPTTDKPPAQQPDGLWWDR